MTAFQKKIASGALAKNGLLDNAAIEASTELLSRIDGSGIETVRVLFADQHGVLRGKTLVASALASVFESGIAVPSTLLLKDTAHKTVFPVWSKDPGIEGDIAGAADVLLVPDPATFRELPWSPHSAWIFCDPVFKSGQIIPFAPRVVLKNAIEKLTKAGLSMVTGLEVEFHVLEVSDPHLDPASSTMPPQPPETQYLAQGYQFLTESRYAELESVIDTLRRYCQTLSLPLRSMEIEMGPSQLEFTFDPADPLSHADNMIMFRTMVKEVCHSMGAACDLHVQTKA